MRRQEQALSTAERALDLGLCAGCGRCCMAGSALEATASERDYLTAAGSTLRHIPKSGLPPGVKPKRGREVYVQETDCGNYDITTGACVDYDNRPAVCREFKAGSFLCGVMRESAGLPVDLPMPAMRVPE